MLNLTIKYDELVLHHYSNHIEFFGFKKKFSFIDLKTRVPY